MVRWRASARKNLAISRRRLLIAGICAVAVGGLAGPTIARDHGRHRLASSVGINQTSSDRTASKAAKASAPNKAVATKGISVFRYGEHFASGSQYERYAYVIVDRGHARAAAALPGKALIYTSGADIANFNTGVTKARAASRGWLLRDSGGAVVESDDYDGMVLADVGDRSYQQEWLQNVLALLRSTRAEGVFIDDVMSDLRSWTKGRLYPAKYPDQPSWANAMASFLEAVGPTLEARGYYVLVNADGYLSGNPDSNNGSTTVAWWQRLAPNVNGLLNEYWVQNPTDFGQLRTVGPDWNQRWDAWQGLVSVAQRAGADFFGLTYGSPTDFRSMRFGRASFLLDWNGKGGSFAYDTHERADPYNPAWTAELGRPLRRKIQLAEGVWRRRFERAIVVVNATSAPVSVLVSGVRRTIDATDALIVST